MKRTPLLILFVVGLLSACVSIDCPVNNVVRTYYELKTPAATADTLKDTLTIVSHRVDGTDTLLLNKGYAITKFNLHVGHANPEDTLYFRFSNGAYKATDTVWVRKENYPHFESVDCAGTFFHQITGISTTHHAIDSIVINYTSVTYDTSPVHFYLYLKKRH